MLNILILSLFGGLLVVPVLYNACLDLFSPSPDRGLTVCRAKVCQLTFQDEDRLKYSKISA